MSRVGLGVEFERVKSWVELRVRLGWVKRILS